MQRKFLVEQPVRERKMLDRTGRKNLYSIEQRVHRYRYDDDVVKKIEKSPVGAWLVESDLGEQLVMITDTETTIDFVVDLMTRWKWRVKFTVKRLDAGMFRIQPSPENRYMSMDARKVNQSLEVVV